MSRRDERDPQCEVTTIYYLDAMSVLGKTVSYNKNTNNKNTYILSVK